MGRLTKRAKARADWEEALEMVYLFSKPPVWLAQQGARALRMLPDKGRKRAEVRAWQS